MQLAETIFPTQEIGSIAKPGWRVKGVSDDAIITPKEVEEASYWGKFLGVRDYEKLLALLNARVDKQRKKKKTKTKAKGAKSEGKAKSEAYRPTDEDKELIRDFSVEYVLAMFRKVGLNRVYSGEQWRVEMYEHLVRNIEGFKLLGSVHSFDYKYFTKGAVVDPPRYIRPIHLDEFEFVKAHTDSEVKIPITGPYTVVDWSFNEYYETEARKRDAGETDLRKIYFEARRNFMLDLVKNALRPEVENLIRNGARWIQIDEPAVTTRPDDQEMELFVDAINELTSGFSDCAFSVHNCYSDYKLLARYAPRLRDIKQLALEFANRDGSDLGTEREQRPGYVDLELFEQQGYEGGFGLGVLHVHDYSGKAGDGATIQGRNILESPKLVRDRILFSQKLLGDPSRISVNPDCGLRTRSWDVTFKKLSAMCEGTALARSA
jgi:5-methyltetrahydropteroyltriglutamate--homocysteine methyltransferase